MIKLNVTIHFHMLWLFLNYSNINLNVTSNFFTKLYVNYQFLMSFGISRRSDLCKRALKK